MSTRSKAQEAATKNSKPTSRSRSKQEAAAKAPQSSKPAEENPEKILKLSNVHTKVNLAQIHKTYKAMKAWDTQKKEQVPHIEACKSILVHLESQSQRLAKTLERSQNQVTDIYQGLMENDAIRVEPNR